MNSSFDKTSNFLTTSPWTFVSPEIPCLGIAKVFCVESINLTVKQTTYNWAIPAFRTAELTALIAVWMQFSNCDKSPLAPGWFFCSASTNRVRVIALASNVWPWLVMIVSKGEKIFSCKKGRSSNVFKWDAGGFLFQKLMEISSQSTNYNWTSCSLHICTHTPTHSWLNFSISNKKIFEFNLHLTSTVLSHITVR